LVSNLSDLTIDLPLLNLKENQCQFHIVVNIALPQIIIEDIPDDLSLYRTGYIRVTPTRVQGTRPPSLLMHLNARGAPTQLPVGIDLRIRHQKALR
jgi:hypothetical protein